MKATGSHAIGAVCTLGTLLFALAPEFRLTLLCTLAIGAVAGCLLSVLRREAIHYEFAIAVLVPVFGLLAVGIPAVAIAEIGGMDPGSIALGMALGTAAGTAAGVAVVLARGTVPDRLPERTLGVSGQLLVPFGVAVLLVYIIDQLRIFALLPTPVEAFVGIVTYPGETSQVAGLLLTPLLATGLCLLCGYLLSRPLAYGLLTVSEQHGRLLTIAARTMFVFGAVNLAVGWGVAMVLMAARSLGLGLPGVIARPIAAVGRFTQEPNVIAALVVGIVVTVGVVALASPFLFFRLAGKTGTDRFVRYVFPAAFAVVAGLSAAFLAQQLFLQTPAGIERLHELGDPAWQVANLAPVLFTALPLLGASVLFSASAVALAALSGERNSHSVARALQTTVLAALFLLAALSAAAGTATAFVVGAAICAVIAWDSFEYGHTLAVELPAVRPIGANELVHAAGTATVAAAGAVLAVSTARLATVASPAGATLPAALAVLAGTGCLLLALDVE